MQLFDLLNNLINLNTTLRKKNLEVIRYNIIPMTNEHGHNGGLIRWIEDSEPINSIINNVSFSIYYPVKVFFVPEPIFEYFIDFDHNWKVEILPFIG